MEERGPGRGVPFVFALLGSWLAFGCAAAPGAQANDAHIVSEKRISPRVIELTIETPAFIEPTKVNVNLPTGYDAKRNRRWPVTYFLAGTMNTYRTFNTLIDGVGLTEDYPSILVSPNGDSGYWSDWYNGGAFGPPMYETYVVDQLLPLIDKRFRTKARRSKRVVFGASMGGYGAMMVAARHPDLFSAAASLSGAVDSNLPANGAVLSASPTFQGADADAIYGPRTSQEVRWHGHNPTDIADNLRDLDLQVRSANGVPNPGIGENPASADSVSCVVEGGVYMASVSFHDKLDELGIPHLWNDYGPGCHTPANFTREVADTLDAFTEHFGEPSPRPKSFDYASIEPEFDIWGWHIAADPDRALEFLQISDASRKGITLTGSGTVSVTTPRFFAGKRKHLTVDLGPADTEQQYTSGATTTQTTKTVTFRRHQRAKRAPARGKIQHYELGSGESAFPYIVYTPPSYKRASTMPLVVMTHGCQTTASEQMKSTLFNKVAKKAGFVVLYPDIDYAGTQQPGPLRNCWRFFDGNSWHRDQGDAGALAGMTRAVMASKRIDPKRVYMVGMSAGSFMTSIMSAAYPDLFAAVVINAGGAYADPACIGTNTNVRTAEESARLAFEEMGPRARVVPRMVMGGDSDQGIPPACADKALEQGLRTNNLVIGGTQDGPISLTPASVEVVATPGRYDSTVSTYLDPDGCLVGRRWSFHGMNHFWPGGSTDPELANFTDPKAPNGAKIAWRFLRRYTKGTTGMPCAEASSP